MPVTKRRSHCSLTALAFALCVSGCDRSPSTPSPLRSVSTPGPGPSSTTSPTPETLVAVGQRRDVALTNGDPPHYVGEAYESDYCHPCKLIRVDGMLGGARARVTLRWSSDDELQMWASNGYDVRKAEAESDRDQVVEVGAGDWIYVGLPLNSVRKPQYLKQDMTFQISVG